MKKTACPAVGKNALDVAKRDTSPKSVTPAPAVMYKVVKSTVISPPPYQLMWQCALRTMPRYNSRSIQVLHAKVTTSGLQETNSVRIWTSRMQGLSCTTRLKSGHLVKSTYLPNGKKENVEFYITLLSKIWNHSSVERVKRSWSKSWMLT